MSKKILVVGGTGFIGSHLVSQLIKDNYQVRVLSRKAPVSTNHTFENVEYLSGSFLALDCVKKALTDIDIVYHLAVTTTPGSSNDQILYDAQTNLMGSLNLIQVSAEANVSRFIFVSSGGSVYGPTKAELISETTPTNPISAHGVSKLAIEKYLEIYRRQFGLDYRIARAGNPYGERQNIEKGQGFIAYAMQQIAQNKEITVWGDGSVVRDFFYVEDLVDALRLMLDDEESHKTYNVGSGQGLSLNEIIESLREITHQQIPVTYQEGRPADVPYNALDISRISSTLGWTPKISLTTGLARCWSTLKTPSDVINIAEN
ncbi:MAG: NAD-dependent epimerase/dehydratase family protein [Anaerolineae bacterium]|nr:NAD-dependent epimerase/dehydratase family protein [Anaerolineae bacterium]